MIAVTQGNTVAVRVLLDAGAGAASTVEHASCASEDQGVVGWAGGEGGKVGLGADTLASCTVLEVRPVWRGTGVWCFRVQSVLCCVGGYLGSWFPRSRHPCL